MAYCRTVGRRGWGNQRLLWWPVFGLLFVVCGCWALAMPRGTAPDEAHQMVRSAAVVRGQWAGGPTEMPLATVTVPEGYAVVDAFCFIGDTHVPLAFAPPDFTEGCWAWSDSSTTVETATPHRGQPTYYLLAGLPTLWASPTVAMYLMRLLAAAACCTLMATGITALLRLPRPGLALLAGGAALTPTVLYFSSMVNPAGLELAATFSLTACGLALVARSTSASPAPSAADTSTAHGRVGARMGADRWLVHQTGISLVVLTLTRGLSGLFALLILAAVAVLAGRQMLLDLLRRRAVQVWLAAGACGVALSVAWTAFIRSRFVEPHWEGSGLSRALGDVGWWSREMVAVFGTTDVVPPVALHLLWLAAVVWLGWQAARRRAYRSLAVAGVLVGVAYLALIIPGQAFGVPQTGYWWQGRYVLPLVLAAVLVLGFGPTSGAGRAVPSRSVTTMTRAGAPGWSQKQAQTTPAPAAAAATGWAVLLIAGHLWAFGYAVRHYTVGPDGPLSLLDFGFDPVWSPPLVPPAVFVLTMAAGLVGLAWMLARAARRCGDEPSLPQDADAAPTSLTPEPAL